MFIPLMLVIFYSTYRHLGYGLWNKQAAHFVVSPFYRDHTSYGAATAIYIPFLVMFYFQQKLFKKCPVTDRRSTYRCNAGIFVILQSRRVVEYNYCIWGMDHHKTAHPVLKHFLSPWVH